MKSYSSKEELKEKMVSGAKKLFDNVSVTLGPKGHNVIIQEAGKRPIITKDGISVAEFVELEDPFENAAVQIIKQASRQTNIDSGDGTTTSMVLAYSMFAKAQKYINSGVHPGELKTGMNKCVADVVSLLESRAKPIKTLTDIQQIATISANNDSEVGELIRNAVAACGKDGSIIVEDSKTTSTTLDLIDGYNVDSGYISDVFINDEKKRVCSYHDPLILVADIKIDTVKDILHVLEFVAHEKRSFVIIASEVEGQALAALISNAIKGTMTVSAIRAPGYGDEKRKILQDIAIAVNADFVSNQQGVKLADVRLSNLGTCSKMTIGKSQTTIVGHGGSQEKIQERIESIKAEIEQTSDLKECERLQDRIVRLAAGVAIIKVGAPTEIEAKEKRHRIDDALGAVKAARLEGIVPGGGVALLKIAQELKNTAQIDGLTEKEKFGYNLVLDAIVEPFRRISFNADEKTDFIQGKIEESEDFNFGYDFKHSKYVDMFDSGVVDPAKVTRTALQNALSAVATLISTSHAIVEAKK